MNIIIHSGHGFIRSLEKRNCFIFYTFEVASYFITSIALERHMKTYDSQLLNMHVINSCFWKATQKSFDRTYCVKESAPYLIPCPLLPTLYYYNWNILCFGTFIWNMWTTGTWIDSEKMSFWATFLTGSFSDPILTRFLNFVGEWKNCLLLVKSL